MKKLISSIILCFLLWPVVGCDDPSEFDIPQKPNKVIIDRPSETQDVDGRPGWIHTGNGVLRRTDNYQLLFQGRPSLGEIHNAIDTVDQSLCANSPRDEYHIWIGNNTIKVGSNKYRDLNKCETHVTIE